MARLVIPARSDKGETFCKYKDEKDNLQGVDMATLSSHTIGEDTVLILSTRENFNEIESADDIRAILAFNYEEFDDDDKKYELNILVLCSNQITKLRGAETLLLNLINVSRENGIRLISLAATDNAVTYYEKFGFMLESPFRPFMSLPLGGKLGGKRMVIVVNLKSRKPKKSRTKMRKNKNKKSRKSKKSRAKTRRNKRS